MAKDILFNYETARFSYRISALPIKDGQILLQCPVGTEEYAFIGGHVSFGETAEETLRREIREEIHTDVTVGSLLAVGEVFLEWKRLCHQIGLYFLADIDASRLPEGDRFIGWDEVGGERYDLEYVWVPLEKLRTLTVYPPQVAQHLLSGRKDVLHFTYWEIPRDTVWPE